MKLKIKGDTMIAKLEKLVEIWTQVGEAVLVQANRENAKAGVAPAAPVAEPAAPKERKKREPKVEPPAAPLPSLDETQSVERLSDLSRAMVARFPEKVARGEESRAAGFWRVRDALASLFGPGTLLGSLSHAQRLQAIAEFERQINAAETKPAATASPIGV